MALQDGGHRLTYLPALDGLRGAAVAVVVAFHAHWLIGGYLGVDLFFVLSGFLITRLLLNEYGNSSRIDLVEFWKRRARRLLPALLVVVAFAAIAERYRGSLDGPAGGRRDVVGALTYSTNWLRLSSGAGYWRQFGDPAVLDHTWSLAIEEQFYVVWPLLVFALLRLVRSNVGRIGALAVASVGLGFWSLRLFSTTSDASRVYMGTDTRAVALLLGATVAAIAHWRPRQSNGATLQFVGLASFAVLAIMMARMRGDALITYEGGLVACSLAGALVVAVAAVERPAHVFRVFTTLPLRWLGQRSYGIYLWHWPIMVGLDVAGAPNSATWRRVAAIAATLIVSEVSYRFIEQPIRKDGLRAFHRPLRTAGVGFAMAAIAMLVVFVPPLHTTTAAQVPLPTAALPTATTAPTGPTASTAPTGSTSTLPVSLSFPMQALPDGRAPRVMFVGDSVGWYLAIQAGNESDRLGIDVSNEAHPECPLTDAPLSRRAKEGAVPLVFGADCYEAVRNYRDTVAREQPDVVIMVFGASFLSENEIAPGEWRAPCTVPFDNWLKDQIRKSADALSSSGATVYWATQAYYRAEVDGRTPTWDDQIDCENAAAREVVAQSDGTMGILEVGEWACPTRDCLAERDGYVLRSDGTHFREEGGSLANIWMLGQIFNPPPWTRVT